MRTQILLACLALLPVAACREHITDSRPADTRGISVLTQHNDNARTGWNDSETVLTTSNVNVKSFGKLFTLPVDDQVYAQPLVAGDVQIAGGQHAVVYIATVNNTVYAYDGTTGKLYWQRNYTPPGMRPPTSADMTGACGGAYHDFSGNIGIVGTPVIDAASGTMYFIARGTAGGNFVQYLHAVSLVDGQDVGGGPVPIAASVSGTGTGSANGVITFDARRGNQRQGLTLVNGIVYTTFSSHCDWGPYHGWILGYDAATLQQRVVYNDTPDGDAGGMWESGAGMAADSGGNLYVVTGNGTVGDSVDPTSLTNRAESALKLSPAGSTLHVASYFTPYNYQTLNQYDLDYGGMGALLIPNSTSFLTAAKDGTLFLLNRDDMGGLSAASNQVRQAITLGSNANLHCQPAYYGGGTKEFVYVWSENDPLRAIPFDRASNLLDKAGEILATASEPTGQSGAMLTVSSNGSQQGTGILWAWYALSGDAEHVVSPGILRAFDASDVRRELWNSYQDLSRDATGSYAKFASPTVANGRVYLPTFSDGVVVYGLR